MSKKWKAGGFPFYIKNGKVQVCLITSTDPNFGGPYPAIPKGNPDLGESPAQTAVREMHEETGIPYSAILETGVVASEEVSGYILHVYWYRLGKKVKLIPNKEASGHWYSLKKAKKVIRPSHLILLEKFIKQL